MCRKIAMLFLATMMFAASAHANPIAVDFTASNFDASAPIPEVHGTIVYEAINTYAPIQAVSWMNLTVGTHTYTPPELAFISPFWTYGSFVIGGADQGANAIGSSGNDFSLFWDQMNSTHRFTYMIDGVNAAFGTWDFSEFSVTDLTIPLPNGEMPTVPEPSAVLLVGVGLFLLTCKMKRKAQ